MTFETEYTEMESLIAGLDERIALLLSTREGTIPLDREFGLNMDFLDMPPISVQSLYTAEVIKKIAKFIPEIRVKEVVWQNNAEKMIPKVVITNA